VQGEYGSKRKPLGSVRSMKESFSSEVLVTKDRIARPSFPAVYLVPDSVEGLGFEAWC